MKEKNGVPHRDLGVFKHIIYRGYYTILLLGDIARSVRSALKEAELA